MTKPQKLSLHHSSSFKHLKSQSKQSGSHVRPSLASVQNPSTSLSLVYGSEFHSLGAFRVLVDLNELGSHEFKNGMKGAELVSKQKRGEELKGKISVFVGEEDTLFGLKYFDAVVGQSSELKVFGGQNMKKALTLTLCIK
jgi:hypothetical protein